MTDWGPVFMSVVLFIILTPGLLFQIPGRSKVVEFGNFQTSGVSIVVHTIIYFALICIFLLAIQIHIFSNVLEGLQDLDLKIHCWLRKQVDEKMRRTSNMRWIAIGMPTGLVISILIGWNRFCIHTPQL